MSPAFRSTPPMRALAALALVAGLGLAGAGHADTGTQRSVGGVNYAEQLSLAGQSLQLNGAGIRYKAIFKVYAAGLYLEKPSTSLEQISSLPGPKRLSVTMLREIDANELGRLFTRGMEDNMEHARFSRLVSGVLRISEIFSRHKKLLPGETFEMEWVPGQGTSIKVKGQAQGQPMPEPEFFQALLGIWLGPKPADEQLKKELLGG
ncbi:chalcone isomerase family protein [Comamonas composti]|uniref:chalcone isomerase family protein n=1 Tax=Comamonas composti TaxID=408558 RepID=UPI001FE07C25|nr:chalcone isomerase family protein [Comamonas composti]